MWVTQDLVTNVTANKTSNFARRFLNTKLSAGRNKVKQITPFGSKWPNKHPWGNIVTKLNNYNLTNAQKNMIRRVNIAVAAQNKKGGSEVRRAVNFNLTGLSRNNAIAKQRKAVNNQKKKENNNRKARNEENAANKKRNANAAAKKAANNAANRKRRENENMKKFLAAGGF